MKQSRYMMVLLCWFVHSMFATKNFNRNIITSQGSIFYKIASYLHAHKKGIRALDFHKTESRIFASGSLDGMIKVWDMTSTKPLITAKAHAPITSLSFSEKNSGIILYPRLLILLYPFFC